VTGLAAGLACWAVAADIATEVMVIVMAQRIAQTPRIK
jgi:hypothetical protein